MRKYLQFFSGILVLAYCSFSFAANDFAIDPNLSDSQLTQMLQSLDPTSDNYDMEKTLLLKEQESRAILSARMQQIQEKNDYYQNSSLHIIAQMGEAELNALDKVALVEMETDELVQVILTSKNLGLNNVALLAHAVFTSRIPVNYDENSEPIIFQNRTNYFFDDFETGTGQWTVTNDGGDCVWENFYEPWPNSYTLPETAGGGVLAADADNCGGSTLIYTTATTYDLDCMSAAQVWLEFDNDWQAIGTEDFAYVDYSTDFGGTWTNVLTFDSNDVRNTHEVHELPNAAGSDGVMVRFVSVQPGWDWWWAIDNVLVTDTPGGDPVLTGDTMDDPFFVGALPFNDNGSTEGFNADYHNQTAPDVVYQFDTDGGVYNFSLCGSLYDTYILILDDTGGLIASNDDFCGLQSEIPDLSLGAGTYFVVVSGFSSGYGEYALNIWGTDAGCTDNEVTLFIDYDSYAGETSWDLTDDVGNVVAAGGPGSGETYEEIFCLLDGDYTFNIYDSFGDGLYCWEGYYELTSDGSTLAGGPDIGCDYGFGESTPFTVPVGGGGCTDLLLDMYDSFGDTWNGNWWEIWDAAGNLVFTESLDNVDGSYEQAAFCLEDGNYTVVCDYGSWQSEVSWELWDLAGNLLLAGGAPYSEPFAFNVEGDIFGCTDPDAINYNPDATVDDGSCIYDCADNAVVLWINTVSWGGEISWDLYDPAGNLIGADGGAYVNNSSYSYDFCLPDGFYTFNGYDSFGDGWNGGWFEFQDAFGNLLFTGAVDGSFGTWEIWIGPVTLGCMDWTATNYDPEATVDDGSCVYMDGPWGLTADANGAVVDVAWHDPAEVPPIVEYHDGVLQNAFYFYDTYELGYAHGVRFDIAGVYDITAASVKILSEGDAYWPWPNDTHGPVRVMVFDDAGGVPGNMIHDELVTASDGWATVYPGYSGMVGSFYVVASHEFVWPGAEDIEGFGVDGAVDFGDNMYTLQAGVWSTGDVLGYGGDYMFTAWVGGDYVNQEVSYHNEIPPSILGEDNNSLSVHNGDQYIENAPESHPFNFLANRELVGFDVYRDGDMVGSVGPDTYTFTDDDMFDEFVDYCYYARAAYTEGPSIPSNTDCAMFLGDPPAAPENVMAEGFYDDVDYVSGITWTWDWSDGEPVIGESCGEGMVYDCELFCVDEVTAWDYVGDLFCDDGTWGYYLDCPEFENDGGDCAGNAMDVTINILTDNYPGETSWDIVDSAGNNVDGIASGTLVDSATMYSWTLTLDPGTYTFSIFDAAFDGICCFYGEGYYELLVDGTLIASGGEFGNIESHTFTVGGVLLSSSEWNLSSPLEGEKGQANYDMSGIELIQTVTYQNDAKPFIYQPRAVFNLANGTTQQSRNVNRDTAFTLYFTYDGDDYAFTTADMFIDIIGFANWSDVCGVVTATNDWGQESDLSNEACATSGAPEICDYVAPENLTTTDTGVSILLEWSHPDYVDPSMVLGETMGNPYIVDQVPFYATGTTLGFMDDYDEECPYTGSTSADVVYMWDAEPGDWTFDICESDYDTKIYVYDGDGILLGCTDDSCSNSEGSSFRSDLGLTVMDYGTLYIIVDGYSGNEGNYTLEVYSGLPVLSEEDQPIKEDVEEYQNADRECAVTMFNVYLETEEGDCPPGQFMDCIGECFDEGFLSWIGDGFCDDGTFGIVLYCEEFDWDLGDCDGDAQEGNKETAEGYVPSNRNWTYIASTIYPYYEYTSSLSGWFIVTATDGYPDNWNESLPTDPVYGEVVVEIPDVPANVEAECYFEAGTSGIVWSWTFGDIEPEIGAPCGDGMVYDCELFCVDETIAWEYVGDGFCDDGTWGYYLACPEFENDGGDCGGDMNVTVTILTDNWSEETSWDVYDSAGNFVDGIEPNTLEDYTMYTWDLTLEPGSYTFNVWDAFGDGIYCSADGYYQLDVEGVLVGGGPGIGCDFDFGMTHEFTIGGLLLSNSEWSTLSPIDGEKGQSYINEVELIENVTYQNEVKPFGQQTRAHFDLANGTEQANNVNRNIFFTLYLTYDGVDYAFTTSDLFIDVTGFDGLNPVEVCGVVSATEDVFGLESELSDAACTETCTDEIWSYEPPTNVNADGGDTSVMVTWDYEGYEAPEIPVCGDYTITSLPFSDENSNIGMGDDWLVSGSQGADVAYALTLNSATTITVSLCGGLTSYDSKLEIFTADENCTGLSTGYYNDDACGLQSEISNAYLEAGTYFIVVDGYGGGEGNFGIDVWESAALASEPIDPDEGLAYESEKSGVDIADLNWNYVDENASREEGVTHFNVYADVEGDVLSIMLMTDNYGSETTWDLYNDDTGMLEASGGPYDSATSYQIDLILTSGNYTWTIYDSFGDGICCTYGEGFYELYMNEMWIAGGGEFLASESVSFNTADGSFAVGQNDYLSLPTWEKGTEGIELEMTPIEIIENGQFPLTESREIIWIGSTNQLSFEVMGQSEGCFYVTADDNSTWDNESDMSDEACAGGCDCEPGDFTCDGSINVLDIVQIVAVILNGVELTECELFYADYTGDGLVNVLDIVQIVAIILNPPSRSDNADSASFMRVDDELRINANGFVYGIQMTLSHDEDFSINLSDAWFADYVTSDNTTRLLIIDSQTDVLFTYTGEFEIVEALAANTDGMINVNLAIPMDFNLGQAYPNPFNPTTHLTLDLPSDGIVSIQVYNVVGQLVETLVDNHMTAGSYDITWNAGNIPSGMYFVRSAMGSEVRTQKVMLLK